MRVDVAAETIVNTLISDVKMAAEKFCLKWNEFESNIGIAFRELRESSDFFDVTLACDDKQIQAHKVILSACSPFFRSVLRRNPHAHPLLYLKGVTETNLKAILDFMYHGEVQVSQENLNSFLAAAEELKVKGLTQNQPPDKRPSPSPEPSTAPTFPSRPSLPPAPKKPRPNPAALARQEEQGSLVKQEPEDQSGLGSDSSVLPYQDFEEDKGLEVQGFGADFSPRGELMYSGETSRGCLPSSLEFVSPFDH